MSKTKNVYITRRVHFSAAHRLYRNDLTPEENFKTYGKCTTPFGHGHNYEVFVTLKGKQNSETGMVMNLTELHRIIHETVLEPFDHHHFNHDVVAFEGVNPTAEWMVVKIWELLAPQLPKNLLYEIKCRETENNTSIYRGEVMSMPVVYISRRATFSSAHRLFREQWSEEKNWEVFGKCSRSEGHGHNYTVEVTLKGEINPATDMLMNLTDLKSAIENSVIEKLDHRNLSKDVPELVGINTTAENLVVEIWKMLEFDLPAGVLDEVKLTETENNFAVYRGE